MNIRENILKEIEKKNITPKPRWQFLLRDSFLWSVGALAIAVGSVAFSLTFFLLANRETHIAKILSLSGWWEVLSFAPLLWAIFAGGFLCLGWYHVKHTQRGYRFHIILVVSIFVLPLFFGWGLYRVGGAHFAETLLDAIVPGYVTLLERRQEMWMHPEKGLLIGKVVGFYASGDVIVLDPQGMEWRVIQAYHNREMRLLKEGALIRIVGTMEDSSVFHAQEIFLFRMHGHYPNTLEGERDAFGGQRKWHLQEGAL